MGRGWLRRVPHALLICGIAVHSSFVIRLLLLLLLHDPAGRRERSKQHCGAAAPPKHALHPLTLAHWALHVAHDEAVLVVQELHADLGDLWMEREEGQSEQGPTAAALQASQAPLLQALLTCPREPVRPMTFITIASLAG